MTLTDQQRAAAHAPGSVAVLAGAGSGKTHMLVARYLHLLESYSPLEIVAATFTEAGAAELRARVRQAVQRQRPGDVETLAELEAAQISTIHALCGRVVRDHPAAAGVRPDVTVMDAGQTKLWVAQHFRRALGELPGHVFRQLPFSEMAATLKVLLGDPLLAEQALNVGAGDWSNWTRDAQQRAREALIGGAPWQEITRDLHRHQGDPGDRIEQARLAAVQATADVEAGRSVTEALARLKAIKLVGGSARQWPGGGFDVVKEALKALRELVDEALKEGVLTLQSGPADDWLMQVLPDVRTAFTEVRGALSEMKRRAGLMDFADMEVCALRALGDPAVVTHYSQRWKAVLVDEAQDNNPVQAQILDILSRGTQRTVVGDLKQSIYGFRRAAPDLFQATSESIVHGGGQQVDLNLSFRTHKGLIDVTNRVFGHLISGIYTPLEGVRAGPDAPALTAWHIEDVKPKSAARAAEAALIALEIQARLEQRQPVHDKATGQDRPIQPGDVAVLTRGWAALEPVRRALLSLGLPVQDIGGGSLLLTQEARDALALLSAVALQDEASLVTVLRSPFLAVSDPVIQDLADAAQADGWFAALRHSHQPELLSARQLFGELQRLCRQSRPSALLRLADRLTGYTAVMANLWDAERRLADWQGFLDLVSELERSDDGTFGVVRTLREYVQEGVEVPRPPLQGRDAVTLTTMHSSKGLEWPLVIVADLNWAPPPGTDDVLMDARLGVALRGPFEEAPALHTLISADRAAKDEAETRRLLYVALTRARDHLILTANGPGKGKSLLGLLTPALSQAGVSVAVPDAPPFQGDLGEMPDLPVPPAPSEYWTDPAHLVTVPSPSAPHDRLGTALDQDGWEEILELLDPAWLDFARRLAEQGIPAPSDVHVDLPTNGRVSGKTALMIWNRPKQDVLLTEGQAPVAGALAVRLTDEPSQVAALLHPLLRGD